MTEDIQNEGEAGRPVRPGGRAGRLAAGAGRLLARTDLEGLRRSVEREFALLASLALAAVAIWFFAELADDALEGDTRAFDRWLLLALRNPADLADPLGPVWFEELMRDVTALGSTVILAFLTFASAGFLWLTGRPRAALLVLGAIGGGFALAYGFKAGFERPRPDLVAHAAQVSTASFPSGHATLSAVTYLTLGALLARVQPRRSLKLYLIGLAVLVTIAVGLSRIYLGVHWPTDVLAGWALGSAWALLCWALALWLQRRGRIRPDTEGGAGTATVTSDVESFPARQARRGPRTGRS
jgi:undecaprenyl-diphosphatase